MALFKYLMAVLLLSLTFTASSQGIKWMTWEQAAAANEKQPKKIFVDVYTDWCGWCKKMDATTFQDSAVVQLMNEKFYAVKLNAEQKESILWKDLEWKWVAGGRNGYNELAYELVDHQLSFPTFVMLDGVYARIAISPGYKTGDMLIKELKYASEEMYRTTTWQEYQSKS